MFWFTRASRVPKFKLIKFTRDTTLASGDQVITGVGFKPAAVAFLCIINPTRVVGWGFDDTSAAYAFRDHGGVSAGTYSIDFADSISAELSSGNSYEGRISATGPDGFTIAWERAGSIAGTLDVFGLCFG